SGASLARLFGFWPAGVRGIARGRGMVPCAGRDRGLRDGNPSIAGQPPLCTLPLASEEAVGLLHCGKSTALCPERDSCTAANADRRFTRSPRRRERAAPAARSACHASWATVK